MAISHWYVEKIVRFDLGNWVRSQRLPKGLNMFDEDIAENVLAYVGFIWLYILLVMAIIMASVVTYVFISGLIFIWKLI